MRLRVTKNPRIGGAPGHNSLATARWARRLGRPVAAMAGGVGGLDGAGRSLHAAGAPLLAGLDEAAGWLKSLR